MAKAFVRASAGLQSSDDPTSYLDSDKDVADAEGVVGPGAQQQEALVQVPAVHGQVHQHECACMHISPRLNKSSHLIKVPMLHQGEPVLHATDSLLCWSDLKLQHTGSPSLRKRAL